MRPSRVKRGWSMGRRRDSVSMLGRFYPRILVVSSRRNLRVIPSLVPGQWTSRHSFLAVLVQGRNQEWPAFAAQRSPHSRARLINVAFRSVFVSPTRRRSTVTNGTKPMSSESERDLPLSCEKAMDRSLVGLNRRGLCRGAPPPSGLSWTAVRRL